MTTSAQKITALMVAEYFLKKAASEKKSLTNKKLQKLVYYAQVWAVTVFDKKLFGEKIEAWIHGPAIPSLYIKFKKFESNPIQFDASGISFIFSHEQTKLLDNVWDVYGKYDAEYLEALTHSELPWQEARNGLSSNEPSKKEINLETAKVFYARKRAVAK